jgi:outer membrane protein assembly factor BamB
VISAANVLSGGIANQGRSLSIVDGTIYVQSLNGVYDIVDLATGTLKSSFTSSATAIFPQDQVVLGGASNSYLRSTSPTLMPPCIRSAPARWS